MRKHPINKRIRSSAPTETELTSRNARVRHRAVVRLGRHRNMVKGADKRRDLLDALCIFSGDMTGQGQETERAQ